AHEAGGLEGAELRANAGRLKIVEHRLAVVDAAGAAPEVSGVEAVGESRVGEELLGLRRIVRIDRRLPVELEARGDEAPGDLRKAEGLRLVDRLAVDRVRRREAYAAVVPRRARVPLVREDDPVSA